MNKVYSLIALFGTLASLPGAFSGQCNNCPTGCTSCYYSAGSLTIVSAAKGYSIDNVNDLCYPTCTSTQYYDYGQKQCVNCPNNCASCYQSNGYLIVTAKSGFTADNINGLCYSPCTSTQYYDPNQKQCTNCPCNGGTCKYSNG